MKQMDAHFTDASLRFMRGLKRHNDRMWFNERKAVYEAELKAPMLRVVAAMNEAMLRWAPEHVRAPEKVMMRSYRDIRFSSDKRPYKHQVSAWWARNGMEKTSGAGFYFHVGGTEVVIAAGIYMPEREQLLKLRRFLGEHHAEVRSALRGTKLHRLGMKPEPGHPLSRPPKGFADADPSALDLIQQREWGVALRLPAAASTEATFARDLVRRFEAAAPLVHLLNTPLLPQAPKRTALHF